MFVTAESLWLTGCVKWKCFEELSAAVAALYWVVIVICVDFDFVLWLSDYFVQPACYFLIENVFGGGEVDYG